MPPYLLLVLAVLNLAAFGLYGWDKRRAIRGGRRVPEARLLWFSLPGTAPGAWAAVFVFRHKVRKASYLAKLVLVTAVQIAAVWFLMRR